MPATSAVDPDAFFAWEERLNFDSGHSPTSQGAELIEIVVTEAEPPVISRTTLTPSEFQDWIRKLEPANKACNRSTISSATGSLRLIVSSCHNGGQTAPKQNPEEFPLPQTPQAWKFPMAFEDFDLLCQKFNLPRATGVMLSQHPGVDTSSYFQQFTSPSMTVCDQGIGSDSSERIGVFPPSRLLVMPFSHKANYQLPGLVMKLPGSDLVGIAVSLALSHSFSHGKTDALLVCRYGFQAEYISRMIRKLALLAPHPAAIPTMLCSLYQVTLRRRISTSWKDLFDIERNSGQTGIHLVDQSGMVQSPGSCDDPRISTKAIRVTQLAAAWETYAPRGVDLVTAVRSFEDCFFKLSKHYETEILSGQRRAILDYLEMIRQRADSSCDSAGHLVQRSRLQLEAINNYLAHTSNKTNLELARFSQRIAITTQLDSSIMKSIAFLTMTFLPATFIATLFSTPGISSENPSQPLYWAVSLPTTAVVLGLWLLWTYYVKRNTTLKSSNLRYVGAALQQCQKPHLIPPQNRQEGPPIVQQFEGLQQGVAPVGAANISRASVTRRMRLPLEILRSATPVNETWREFPPIPAEMARNPDLRSVGYQTLPTELP